MPGRHRHRETLAALPADTGQNDSMHDVRAFAGDSRDLAVVEEAAQRALTRWDRHVTHHDVVTDLTDPARATG